VCAVRWLRVVVYALALSAMTLNVIGGMAARRQVLLSQGRLQQPASSKPPPSSASHTPISIQSKVPVVAPPSGVAAPPRPSQSDKRKGALRSITPFQCTAEDLVHVVFASDAREYLAMMTSANSALHNSEHPERLRFHLIYPAENSPGPLCDLVVQFTRAFPGIQCEGQEGDLPGGARRCEADAGPEGGCYCVSQQFHLVPFRATDYDVLTHTTSTHMDRKELLTGVNFARNFMDDLLLPWGVGRAIYLDVDTIVQGDLANLWGTELKDSKYFAAVSSCYLHMTFWFDFNVDIVKNTFSKNDCYINAGVYIVDLQQYKEDRVQKRIESLIVQHQHKKIWKLGVHQSSFVLALANHTKVLDSRWNFVQLGWNKALHPDRLKAAFVLHWNGERKPWLKNGLYIDKWKPYTLSRSM